jgi:hypothetical protein
VGGPCAVSEAHSASPFSRPLSIAQNILSRSRQDIGSGCEALCSDRLCAYGFRPGGDRPGTDPHQSPFWIKARQPDRSRARALAALSSSPIGPGAGLLRGVGWVHGVVRRGIAPGALGGWCGLRGWFAPRAGLLRAVVHRAVRERCVALPITVNPAPRQYLPQPTRCHARHATYVRHVQ